jgi:hypothetical protein
MSENTGWPRRNGYYAGNMDPELIEYTEKWIVNQQEVQRINTTTTTY